MEKIEVSYLIKKIRRADGWWKLYPKGSVAPIYLREEYVHHKLPPVWKFPWQGHKLKIKVVVNNFISYAEMDGVVLFDIPEEQYPDEVKKIIAENWAADNVKRINAKYRKSVLEQIEKYLPQVPQVENVEEKINALPFCWRRFMQKYLFLQQDEKQRQKLMLLYHLVAIADNMYRRDVNCESVMDVVFAGGKYALFNLILNKDDAAHSMTLENDEKVIEHEAYDLYREVKAEFEQIMPQPSMRADIYLSMMICELLYMYAYDYSELICQRQRDYFGDTLENDEEDYPRLIDKMRLPRFQPIFINEKI